MNDLIAKLFSARDEAHRLHLATKSFARHLALGELYDALLEFADDLAEMVQGKYGILDLNQQSEPFFDTADELAFVSSLAEWAESSKSVFDPADTHLLNVWDEVIATIYRVKYKIENLQ